MTENFSSRAQSLSSSMSSRSEDGRALLGAAPPIVEGAMAECFKQALKTRLFPQTASFAPKVGRFTILRELGRGGMGIVYAAYDETLDRRVALKLLYEPVGGDASEQWRLLREAQAMARLNHPNIASVYEAGTHERRVFIAMEFVQGTPLDVWLRERPRAWQDVVGPFVQAGRGLQAAHRAGLVHRDFKPANVMLGTDGRVRVLDFGLARRLCAPLSEFEADAVTEDEVFTAPGSPDAEHATTGEGGIAGTPAYMPPEQFRGEALDHRADQYALCVSLYEALYHDLPFRGRTLAELWSFVLAGPPKTPPKGPRVPNWLYRIVARGLSPDPARRFPSMAELLDALERRPEQRVQRWLLGALGASVLAGSMYGYEQYQHRRCAFGEEELAGIWDTTKKAELREKFTGKAASAGEHQALFATEALLDKHVDAWLNVQRVACEDLRSGKESARLYDRRQQCVRRSKAALTAVVESLTNAEILDESRVEGIARTLAQTPDCTSDDIAQWDIDPPPLENRTVIDRLWQDYYRLRERSPSNDLTSLEAARALVAEVRQADYPPLAVYALRARADVERRLGLHESACASLHDSFFVAEASGNDVQAAANAADILKNCAGSDTARESVGETWARIALAKLQHADEQRSVAYTAMLSDLATSMMEQGRFDKAGEYLLEGLDIVRNDPFLAGEEQTTSTTSSMLSTSSRYLRKAGDGAMKRAVQGAHEAAMERFSDARGALYARFESSVQDYFIHAEWGIFQKAFVDAERAWAAIQRAPDTDAALRAKAGAFLAGAYVDAERCTEALPVAKEAWDALHAIRDPRSLDIHERRGALYFIVCAGANCGDLELAQLALGELRTGDAYARDVVLELAFAVYEVEVNGDMVAVGAAERLLARTGRSPNDTVESLLRFSFLALHAQALMKAGKTERAKASAEQALLLGTKLWPESNLALASPLTTLGRVELELGDAQAAIEHLERAHALRRESDPIFRCETTFALARALAQRDDARLRAQELGLQALATCEAAGPRRATERAKVAAWLAEL